MPPAAKKIPCPSSVKNETTLSVETCKTPLAKGQTCPNRHEHLLKYKTGFCQNGDHEGSARKSPTGKPKKTCDWWKRCPCDCHIQFDRMFAMSGMPRQVVDNSGYSPDHGGFWMPSLEERARMAALSKTTGPVAPRIEESPLPDAVPATIVRVFTPTASGRAAPGELELWVKQHCDIWLVEAERFPCTPAYLSEEIGRAQGIKPPSVGAITAVFQRWVKIGFAEIGAKPARFIKYTDDGVRLGLEGCKTRHKMKRKSAEAAAGRRIGRGVST